MLVVNFFGAPGSGKSTAALGLANEMKRAWLNCEYVPEFAKDQVWAETSHLLSKQNWVFANQEFRLSCLAGKVDFAIVDSPLLLSSYYVPANYPESFKQLCFDFFRSYDNVNFFINRSHKYSAIGRLQDEGESDAIASAMKAFLVENDIGFVEISAGDSTPKKIMKMLTKMGLLPVDETKAAKTSKKDSKAKAAGKKAAKALSSKD